MTTPIVTIKSVSKTKISDEAGADKTIVTFSFDVDVQKWTVNVNGVSYDTGTIADSGGGLTISELSQSTVGDIALKTVQSISVIVAGYELTAEIDFKELYQEGSNRVNLYGKSIEGTWTNYDQQ